MTAVMNAPDVAELTELLSGQHLTLSEEDGRWIVRYEREVHPLAGLPLADLDEGARRAELLAVAAGITAAIKTPGELEDEDFRLGAATVMPRIERARFRDAYDAVVVGGGGDDALRMYTQDFGAGLVVAFVREMGWRFTYLPCAQITRWDISADHALSAVRSNLYGRDEIAWDATSVGIGDGYDAARAVIAGDLFYARAGADGIPLGIPGSGLLLVGDGATPDAIRAAHDASPYPLCPYPLTFARGCVS